MTRSGVKVEARSLVGVILAGGFLLMLGVGLPGHLSFDSIAQLHEGRLQVRETWGPAIYAWLLGFFDRLIPGGALYVVASGLLLFVSLASLPALRPKVSWLAAIVALAIVVSPTLLIYQAIVWKDVLFANCAVAGCVALAHAARLWERPGPRFALLALAVVLLAVAGLVRQNGLIVTVCAAAAVACLPRTRRLKVRAAWGAGMFAAVLGANVVLGAATVPRAAGPDMAVDTGMRILQHYDLVGAASKDPAFAMPAMERSAPGSTAIIKARSQGGYSAQRVDYVTRDKELHAALWRASPEAVRADWLNLVTRHPWLYLQIRADVFRWLAAPPELGPCLPIWVGVDGDPVKMERLRLPNRFSLADQELYDYTIKVSRTPFYSHVTYGLISLAVGIVLLIRRDRADLPIVALMAGALGFAASFFVISIACDHRYLYFVDLAGMTGAFYLALDPRLKRRAA